MKKIFIALLFCSLSFQPHASDFNLFPKLLDNAASMNVSNSSQSSRYNYPAFNPFIATLSSIFTGSFVDHKPKIKRCLKPFSETKLLHVNEYVSHERYTCFLFYRQKKPAPLVFILAGFGASEGSAINRLLAEKIVDELGFNVITIGSPFSWRFQTGALKNSLPGAIYHDSQDVYDFMKDAVHYLSSDSKYKYQATDYYLTGYSLGALESLFIAKQDSEEKFFNFKKVLAVNPPVNLQVSSGLFDDYVKIYRQFSKQQIKKITSELIEVGAPLLFNRIKQLHLRDIEQAAEQIKPEYAKAFIGDLFYNVLLTSTEVADIIHDFEVLNKPTNETKDSYWSFKKYTDHILWPYYKNQYSKFDEFVYRNSMYSLESFIKNNDHLKVHHTLDDIIMGEGELAYIQKIFGNRATFFSKGGHLGNIWYSDNIKAFLHDLVH